MDRISQLIEALKCGQSGCDCLRAKPGKGHVHCPAHADEGPSLSVSEKEGKILMHCFATCSQDSVITALHGKNVIGFSYSGNYDRISYEKDQRLIPFY